MNLRLLGPALFVAALVGVACGEESAPLFFSGAGPESSVDVSDTEADLAEEDLGSDAAASGLSDAVADAEPDADGEDTADAAPDAGDVPNDPSDTEGNVIEADAALDTLDVEDGGAEPGFGSISGSCGVLEGALDDGSSSFFEATIDFADDSFDDPDDRGALTPGGLAVLEAGNAGGSSLYSEVFAFEVLARCDGASLLETERTIEYRPDYVGSITDLLVEIGGERVGVSVTRAVGFPRDEPYTVERALDLLTGKLEDIRESSDGVVEQDAWVKQVLLVIAYADGHVDSLREAAEIIDASIRSDTIVFVVESVGLDGWLY
ncbi:MAG: hypothetical protein ACJAYU_005176 [Bradymonadia bacterium]|jgi:hypothetical protein